MALAEGVIGHADNHPPQIVGPWRLGLRGAVLEKIVSQLDMLQANRRLEDFHRQRTVMLFRRLLDIHQDVFRAVLDFQETHMGRGQRRPQQAVEHVIVAGDHPVLGGRGQLVGDQLAGVVQFLAQVLDPHEGKEADQ